MKWIIYCHLTLLSILVSGQSDSLNLEENYKKILERNQKSAYALLGLASLSYQNGEFEDAARFAERCTEVESTYEADAWVLRGAIELSRENLHGSIQVLKSGYARFPKDYRISLQLAFLYYLQLDYQHSLRYIDSTLSNTKGCAEAWFLKGIVLYEKENSPYAGASLINGLILAPNTNYSKWACQFLVSWIKKDHASIKLSTIEERKKFHSIPDILIQCIDLHTIINETEKFEVDRYIQAQTEYIFTLDPKKNDATFLVKTINQGHVEPLTYYILQNYIVAQSKNWFYSNSQKTSDFADWLELNLEQ